MTLAIPLLKYATFAHEMRLYAQSSHIRCASPQGTFRTFKYVIYSLIHLKDALHSQISQVKIFHIKRSLKTLKSPNA